MKIFWIALLMTIALALVSEDYAKADCQNFPANNVWNTPIDKLPVHKHSAQWVANIGSGTGLHADFAAGQWNGSDIGIPVTRLDPPIYSAFFTFEVASESDQVRYPVNPNVQVEQGSDKHVISIDNSTCKLYELFGTDLVNSKAYSGAVFDLTSNAMRTMGYTSADAAGLPIYPGLVRYSEVLAGAINHAIRFTAEKTHGNMWPGSHMTRGALNTVYDDQPPLGARYRLKPSFDISGYAQDVQVILKALQTYGMILADNGANWYLSGNPDSRWNDDWLATLDKVKGSNFEVVDESCLIVSPASYAASPSQCKMAQPAAPMVTKSATSTVTMPAGVTEWRLMIKIPQ